MTLKKQAISVAFALSFAAIATGPAFGAYATSIVDSSPLANGSPTGVLGAPDGVDAAYDQVDATTAGFVTVSFDLPFANVPGADLFVHVVEWPLSEDEIFEVFASLDGTPGSFFSLGSSGPPTGGDVAVGFDLAAAGMSSARFVRVQNSRNEPAVKSEGPEIDAIESVRSVSVVPEPGSLGSLGLALGLLGLTSYGRWASRFSRRD